MSSMEPFLENTDYTNGLINTTINMTEMIAYNTTKNLGVTKFCSFNHPSELELEPTSHKMREYIEIIKDF